MHLNPPQALIPKDQQASCLQAARFADWKADLDLCTTDEERREFIRTTLQHKDNLHIFGRFFFPHIIKGEDDPPPAHLDLLRFLSSPDTGAAIFPRGFAKSTWEKIDTIHDIVYRLEPVILYISSSIQDAQFHFESIKGELENNDLLRGTYGDLVPKIGPGVKWNNTHFETTNGVNVVARGPGKGRGVNIRNQRPTKAIIDDAETDEMTHSVNRRKKFWRWITEVVVPSLDKASGRLKMIGTVIHPEAAVLRFYREHGGIFRRAIENEQSIWPAFWSLERLHQLRDGYTDANGTFHHGIGLRAFMQEYMNEPIHDESAIFKQAWLDAHTYERLPAPDEIRNYFTVKMVVDPQAGLSDKADFMGVVVLGLDRRTGKRWVLHASRHKAGILDQLRTIHAIYVQWNPQVLGVEKVLNQTAMYQLLAAGYRPRGPDGKETGEIFRYRLVALSPEGKDKVNRARYVEPLVEQGVVLFNPAHTELYDEMIAFPSADHDDLVDAFVYANSLFESTGGTIETKKAPLVTAGLRKKDF